MTGEPATCQLLAPVDISPLKEAAVTVVIMQSQERVRKYQNVIKMFWQANKIGTCGILVFGKRVGNDLLLTLPVTLIFLPVGEMKAKKKIKL